MTISDFEHSASERIGSVEEARAASGASGTNLKEFLDDLSLNIACRYLDGQAGFEYCDAVMNGLHDAILFATPSKVSSEIAWAIFLAFDAGEFHSPSDGPEVQPEQEYTRPQLVGILKENQSKPA